MNVKVLSVILCLLLLSGCTTHPIPEHFRPLEELSERPWWLGGESLTTIHTTAWVRDIDAFLRRKPEGSALYNGIMIHERIHSLRMGNIFTTGWFILQYAFSTDFMWEEESIGWYFQLIYLKKKGFMMTPEYTANFLQGVYTNLTGSMISFEDAKQWVEDVYSGKWKPDISEEEWDLYYYTILEELKNAQ